MSEDQPRPQREERIAQLLQRAAASERAPESLRTRLRTVEEEATRQARSGARSARQAFGGAGVSRLPAAALPAGGRPTAGRPSLGQLLSSDDRRMRRARLVLMPLILVVVVAVVAVIHSGSQQQQPSVAQVASLSTLSAAEAAPRPTPSGTELTTAVQGLHFPDWSGYGGWRAVGARRDELRGRPVTTVFYAHAGRRLAYSIVATPAIVSVGTAADAHQSFRQGARTFVVWTASDHTCMLSGADISAAKLWHLAQGS